MNYLTKSTAESAIGAFSGNRMVRYACDEKPNLKKFNTHDYIAIGTGIVTPVLTSHFLKASVCASLCVAVGFHSVTGLVISGGLTYLFQQKETHDAVKAQKDLKAKQEKAKKDLEAKQEKSAIKIQSCFRKHQVTEKTKTIKFIDEKITQAHNDITAIFGEEGWDANKYKTEFSKKLNRYKEFFLEGDYEWTKEKTEKRVSETADLLKAVKEKYQIFKEYVDKPNGFSEEVAKVYLEQTIRLVKNSTDNLFKELGNSIDYHGSSYAVNKLEEQWRANRERQQLTARLKITPQIKNAFESFGKNAEDIIKDILTIQNGDTEEIFKKRVNKKINRYSLTYHPDKNPNNYDNADKATKFLNTFKETTFDDAKKLATILR